MASTFVTQGRITEPTGESELFTIAALLYSLPQTLAQECEAIVVFPGLGEIERLVSAIRLWERPGIRAKYLLVAGHNTAEKDNHVLTVERLMREYGLIRTRGVVCQGYATHTREQANWIVRNAFHRDIQSMALVASAYHLVRAYLTTLKAFLTASIQQPVALIPLPALMPPHKLIPDLAEQGVNSFMMTPGEVERILHYQEKGDVATSEEFVQYLIQLWQIPLLQSVL